MGVTVARKRNVKQAPKSKQAPKASSPAQSTPRESPKPGVAKRGSRQRRKEAAQRARRRRTLRRAVIIAAVAAALAGLAWPIYQSFRADADLKAALTAGSYTYDQNSDPERDHVANPSYKVNPPAGGAHLKAPANPGDYSGESAPPDGALVHSMEHGNVILWHRPDLNADGQAALKAIAAEFPSEVILVERESMPTRVAATAWHQRILGDRVERKTVLRFISEFRDQGPENVG
ncbi:MAG: DUF3105 domain-containing protein [Micromonosporaceae bacterium]|nr:DUF3105 domain-containing protein [Micromonosporaceae bacterium]